MPRLECQQSDRHQHRLPYSSCHLSSVRYAALGSMKVCTELRTILMVGYGHKLRPGERYSANMSTYEAEQLLRKDLRELCAIFRSYGQDSLLLAALSYNIGPYKVTGYKGKYPKSSVLKKLEVGNRNFREDYVNHCHWRGKRIPSIERRRYAELMLLFTP
jgi:lysozyme